MIIALPDLHIRPSTEKDAFFLQTLYRSTRDDLLQLGLPDAMFENLLEMQFRAQQASYRSQFPDAKYAVVEKAGEAVGCLLTDEDGEEIRLVYIAFLPQARNRGHGRSLLRALQAKAEKAKKTLALSVDPRNTPALHLYRSAGFEVMNDDGANLEMVWPRS